MRVMRTRRAAKAVSMKRILFPFDGSEAAQRAIGYVVSAFLGMRPLEVMLLNVQPPIPMRDLLFEGRPSELHKLEAPLREAGGALLASAKRALDVAGIENQMHVEIGEPAQVICDFAKRYHCELIAMGTRGMGAVSGLVLGSVATKVLHLSPVPVMLLR